MVGASCMVDHPARRVAQGVFIAGLSTFFVTLWESQSGQHLITEGQEFHVGDGASATFIGSNNMAAFMLMVFAVSVHTVINGHGGSMRIAGFAMVGLSGWTAMESGSRLVFIALPAIVAVLLLMSLSSRAGFVLILLLTLLPVALWSSPHWMPALAEQQQDASVGATESDQARENLALYAIGVMWRTGGIGTGSGGLGAFQASDVEFSGEPVPVHNMLAQAGAEYGILGLLLMALIMLSPLFLSIERNVRRADSGGALTLASLALVMTGWLGLLLADLTWWTCMALALVLGMTAARRGESIRTHDNKKILPAAQRSHST